MDEEKIVRVCGLRPGGESIPIFVGPEPSSCQWIVVTYVPAGPPAHPHTYTVYFVAPDGAEIDFAHRDTLQEALDTAASLSELSDLRWIRSEERLGGGRRHDVDQLTRIVSAR